VIGWTLIRTARIEAALVASVVKIWTEIVQGNVVCDKITLGAPPLERHETECDSNAKRDEKMMATANCVKTNGTSIVQFLVRSDPTTGWDRSNESKELLCA